MRFITVGELKHKLNSYDDNLPIMQSRDSEGNNYSALDDFSVQLVEVDYDGEESTSDLFSKEDILDENPDMTENGLKNNFKEVLVLWPV